jgi:hypothetical protein
VWRNFHILNRAQVFLVSSLSATIVATPFAIASILHERAGLFRDLGWPHQFDPLIIFGSVFLSLIPVFLAYYHLGRLGAMFSLAVAVATFYGTSLCALLFFEGGVWSGAVGYTAICLLLYTTWFVLHTKAGGSRQIQDAQRRLGLTTTSGTS